MSSPIKPRLRPLHFKPVNHLGKQMWLLNDPWQMSERQIIFPAALAQMLVFCDGTRTSEEIHAAFCAYLGGKIPFQIIADALAELDQAFLLENERFETKRRSLVTAYRAQSYRPPALADVSYPGSPQALSQLFTRYGEDDSSQVDLTWKGRGVVSPHIDYQRGGPVYGRTWRRAAPAVLSADLVLIFGTDHVGRPGSITLTHQPYATPYGVLPTDTALVEQLAEAIGTEAAFAEELNHRNEHSVELSAVWLHYIFYQAGVNPCPMIPILIGSFQHFLNNGAHPAHDPVFNRFLTTLRRETGARRVLAVASVDLAHVGPAFSDPFGMDDVRRGRLRAEDSDLMNSIIRGDAAGFFSLIHAVRDRNRICGFAPLYLMSRYLEATNGRQVAYSQCPADPHDTSLVSICGLLLD